MVYNKIAKVKERIGHFSKDSKNSFQNYKYSSLPSIHKELDPILSELQLSVNFTKINKIDSSYKFVVLVVDVEDDNTETFEYDVELDTDQKNLVKAWGSMTTYARRYILSLLFGIPMDDQDPDHEKNTPQKKRNGMDLYAELKKIRQIKKGNYSGDIDADIKALIKKQGKDLFPDLSEEQQKEVLS